MNGILLAAGHGTRLRPLTLVRPKPLVPLHGIPLLDFGLRQLRKAGCSHIAINAHHLAPQVQAWADEQRTLFPELNLRVVFEEKILGVGGGLRNLLQHLPPGPVLVQNGDVIHDFNLARLAKEHAASGAELSLVLSGQPHVLQFEAGQVLGFRHSAKANRGFTGIHLLSEPMRRRVEKWSQPDIIPCYEAALRDGVGIRGADEPLGLWVDIGRIGDYLSLHQSLWMNSAYRNLLGHLALSARFDAESGLSIGEGSQLLGPGHNSVVWTNAEWRGELVDSCVLDGVVCQGNAKEEIIL